VIDACIPFNRRKTFAAIARASKEFDAGMRCVRGAANTEQARLPQSF